MDPQQPELGRNRKGGTSDKAEKIRNSSPSASQGGQAHGTDKGNKGGGEGGSVPPDQQSPYPA
ncbi:hypothetical protein [Motilibacter rhizosphaerae]|uniref:hypothetical protein n=1 Tax=Motilibacter rhizosphaerae TaxID=598652 RepID=UPI00102B9D8B|nr:hypothetical protein [Motilibacter rhizosphaerae]